MRTARYAFPGGVSRTVIVEDSQRAVVFSPGAPLVDDAVALSEKEVVLVAPSRAHISGLGVWRDALPRAVIIAEKETAARLDGVSVVEPHGATSLLPDGVELRVPAGSGLGEIWMRVTESGRVHWIVCDAFTNLESLAPQPWLRWLQRLYGLRTGLTVSPAFRRTMTDGAGFRAWVRTQLAEGCDTLTPCHGETAAGEGLAARIEQAT